MELTQIVALLTAVIGAASAITGYFLNNFYARRAKRSELLIGIYRERILVISAYLEKHRGKSDNEDYVKAPANDSDEERKRFLFDARRSLSSDRIFRVGRMGIFLEEKNYVFQSPFSTEAIQLSQQIAVAVNEMSISVGIGIKRFLREAQGSSGSVSVQEKEEIDPGIDNDKFDGLDSRSIDLLVRQLVFYAQKMNEAVDKL